MYDVYVRCMCASDPSFGKKAAQTIWRALIQYQHVKIHLIVLIILYYSDIILLGRER